MSNANNPYSTPIMAHSWEQGYEGRPVTHSTFLGPYMDGVAARAKEQAALKVYIWVGVTNEDWTGGDAIAIASSVEEARANLRAAENSMEHYPDLYYHISGDIDVEPTKVLELKNFVYGGMGGG